MAFVCVYVLFAKRCWLKKSDYSPGICKLVCSFKIQTIVQVYANCFVFPKCHFIPSIPEKRNRTKNHLLLGPHFTFSWLPWCALTRNHEQKLYFYEFKSSLNNISSSNLLEFPVGQNKELDLPCAQCTHKT